MLRTGDIVKIIYSKQLLFLDLCELVSREAIVSHIVKKDGKVKGAYVIPQSGRLKDEDWFIPIQSIESVDKIDKLRTLVIMKQTTL